MEPGKKIDKSRSFKDHPRPPLSERLRQAKNFLADEDLDRNHGFREKLAQVEEYVKYIEDEKLIEKPGEGATKDEKDLYRLYHDVKTMAELHSDWDKNVQAEPTDTLCYDAPSVMPVSTRLVSFEQSALIEEERNALGVDTLMRENHPPFTVSRQGDEFEFLRAMQDAAAEDTGTLDKNFNLVWVEGRVFKRAMKEPALIPYWLDEEKGIAKKGIKAGDPDSWYKLYGEGQKLHKQPGRPPPMQDLPKWLELRQEKTNQLLSIGKKRTEEQSEVLDNLLHDVEPEWLRNLHDEYHEEGVRLQMKRLELADQTTDRRTDYTGNEYLIAKKKYRKAAEKWRRYFKKKGTQFMVEDMNREVPIFVAPGVFYFPDERTGDSDFKARLEKANEVINDVKDDLWKKANVEGLQCMIDLFWNQDIFSEEQKSERVAETTKEDVRDLRGRLRNLFESPLRTFLEPYKQLRMLRPGEIDDGSDPETCYFPWTQSVQGMKDSAARTKTTIEANAMQAKSDAATLVPGRSNTVDWRPKAKRRGIQRAAIELALNSLCANHEQHRPCDKFRILQIPGPYITTDLPEITITLPLEPHQRPVELDPFFYTRKVARQYHTKNDLAYETSRQRMIYNYPGAMSPPKNFKGPWVLAGVEDKLSFHRARQSVLTSYYEDLLSISKKYPRPIIDAMLETLEEGLHMKDGEDHKFLQYKEGNKVIPTAELAELREILASSWDEDRHPLKNVQEELPGFDDKKLEDLKEFDKGIQDLLTSGSLVIPFWEPLRKKDMAPEHDEYAQETFDQIRHNPETEGKYGTEVSALMEAINEMRLSEGSRVWSRKEVLEFLEALKLMEAIHYDSHLRPKTVSRIPFVGHPENKYVISREAIPKSRGVYQVTDDGENNGIYVVQYDAAGTIGIPIIQPNKWYHYQHIAFRVGYELALHLQTIADYADGMIGRWEEHWEGEGAAIGLINPSEVENIVEMAYEVHKIAPEIAQEAGLQFEDAEWRSRPENHAAVEAAEEESRETGFQVYPAPDQMHADQAAAILNIQICEELNNNWESRFPEGEETWNFARNRVQPVDMTMSTGTTVGVKPLIRKYFNMRNFPVCCQSEKNQAAIRKRGPVLPEVEKEESRAQELTEIKKRQQMMTSGKRSREIYRGGKMAPFFPFGETLHQKDYLSWRMEKDLQDAPEFQIRKPRSWMPEVVTRTVTTAAQKAKQALNPLSYFPNKPLSPEPFPLPKVPAAEDMITNSGRYEFEADLDEIFEQREETRAKLPGSRKVDPDIKENWYTQEQIALLDMEEKASKKEKKIKEIESAVEKHTKKHYTTLTKAQRDQAFLDLGIDIWAPEIWAGVPKPTANNPTTTPSITMSGANPHAGTSWRKKSHPTGITSQKAESSGSVSSGGSTQSDHGKRGNSGSLSGEKSPKKAATGMGNRPNSQGSKPSSLSTAGVMTGLASGYLPDLKQDRQKKAMSNVIEIETEDEEEDVESDGGGELVDDDSMSDE